MIRKIEFHTGYAKNAGLFTVSWDRKEKWQSTYLHFFPKKRDWMWGKHESWYDGPCYSFGHGPLLLICWT